jgi:hypothetical protein
MPHLYLNSYAPLVITSEGLRASDAHNLPPFIDGSIRREPDLEHQCPSITCLCRAGLFAPRLQIGDVVVYMTHKHKYGPESPHRRLTAVIRVARLFDSHIDAADWYRSNGMPLPSNCMVEGNAAHPVSHSHQRTKQRCGGCVDACGWDAGYQRRAALHPRVVVCDRLSINLDWTAPRVHDADLHAVFGHRPGTRNPGKQTMDRLAPFLARIGIRTVSRAEPAPPSSP